MRNRLKKLLVLMLIVAVVSLGFMGCEQKKPSPGETPKTEHPEGEHPDGEHPAAEHPETEHPAGEHPG